MNCRKFERIVRAFSLAAALCPAVISSSLVTSSMTCQGVLGIQNDFSQLRVMERLEGRLHCLPFDLFDLLVGRFLIRGKMELLDGPLGIGIRVDGRQQLPAQAGKVFPIGMAGDFSPLPVANLLIEPGKPGRQASSRCRRWPHRQPPC